MKLLLGISLFAAILLASAGFWFLSRCRFVATGPESGFNTCDDRAGFSEFVHQSYGNAAFAGFVAFVVISTIIAKKIL